MKAVVALVGNTAATVVAMTGSSSPTHQIAAGIVAFLTVVGVYQIKNKTT